MCIDIGSQENSTRASFHVFKIKKGCSFGKKRKRKKKKSKYLGYPNLYDYKHGLGCIFGLGLGQ